MTHELVLRVVAKLLIPFILLFALYVQFHGDFGPGGGFQAGVIAAAAVVFYALIYGLENARRIAPEIYALTLEPRTPPAPTPVAPIRTASPLVVGPASLDELVVTDTIPLRPGAPSNVRVLPCADLLTDSIRRIFTDDSVSEVFGGENQLF